jgi:choline dehydrogenase-like flavoprotein
MSSALATAAWNATLDILGSVEGGIDRHRAKVARLSTLGTAVTGVELADGECLHARAVVLAAGAFGTPMLLHASSIRPAALGRYLTYHLVLISQKGAGPDVLRGRARCGPGAALVDSADRGGRMEHHGVARRKWMTKGFAHVMGSCRMGEDVATSVVDAHGRVHAYENLFLATVGLLPSRVIVNPTLTGAALAIRTADAIAALLRG